jgi:hypothetical protein
MAIPYMLVADARNRGRRENGPEIPDKIWKKG